MKKSTYKYVERKLRQKDRLSYRERKARKVFYKDCIMYFMIACVLIAFAGACGYCAGAAPKYVHIPSCQQR